MSRLARFCLCVLMAAMLSSCAPLTMLDAVTPHDTYRSVSDLAYGSDPRQALDLYLPLTPLPGHPVVLFFYGGSWQSGQRADYRFVGEALASHGVLTAVADYRLYPQVGYPAFLQDGAQALRWLREHVADYGGNPQRLFLAGHSAGAYNAVMLALDPRWRSEAGDHGPLAGVIGLSGPYDFLPLRSPALQAIFGPPAQWPSTQPVAYVHAMAPPMLLICSDDDAVVAPRNSKTLAERLRAAGDVVSLQVYSGLGHVLTVGALGRPLRGRAPVLDEMVRFIGGDAVQAQAAMAEPPLAVAGALPR